MYRRTLGACLAVAIVTAACGGQPEAPPASKTPASTPAASAPAASSVDPASAGSVGGKVVLEGTAAKNEPIKMNADPVCVRENKGPQAQETFTVGDGGSLANVFVYVKDGIPAGMTFPVPAEAVKMDQKGCRYHPHVFGIRVGQKLTVVNSDPTLHNVHAVPKANKEFNTAQPIQNMTSDTVFENKEVMVPFKCDVHGWMNAFAGVLDHPYFAVSGADGAFDVKNLPPGTYTLEAWHEKLGTQSQSVTIGAKEAKTVTFTFKM
jgi:plastocyanin